MRIEEAGRIGADPRRPVLLAGPTGSGKSALALAIAERYGGTIINADALQVYAHWRILTARPDTADLRRAPHALYGHVPRAASYSVGHWLREVEPLLGGDRPIVVGGTGLYLTALSEGLADIPPTPPAIRAEADMRPLADLLADLDAATRDRLDIRNRRRVQRAWEVLRSTGLGLAAWQAAPAPSLLPAGDADRVVINAPATRLGSQLERRFAAMLAQGALDEVRGNLAGYDPVRPGDRAIGAADLKAYLEGEIDLAAATARAIVATRRYAKRQRTWFRARMRDWTNVALTPS